jgi:hypothetical protein
MPRFFFDFRQSGRLVPDSEGIEFESVEQAYLEAFRTAQEMWSELLKQRRDPRRCLFEVRSAAGDMLFIFPFQEVVDACTDRTIAPMQHTFNALLETHNFARRVRDELTQQVRNSQEVLQESRKLLRHPVE